MIRLNVFVLILLSLATGCVHIEQDLSLNPDGSGNLRIIYGVKETDVQRMRQVAAQMAAIDPNMTKSDADWLTSFDEAAVRKAWESVAQDGVTLRQVKTEVLDGWRYMKSDIQFTSLQKLLDCGMIEQCHIALSRGPSGQYGYQQTLDLGKSLRKLPPGMDLNTIQPVARMLLADFEAKFRIQVPGNIIRSNADRVEGRKAIWEVDGEDSDVIARIQSLDMRVLFEGKDLKISDARMSP